MAFGGYICLMGLLGTVVCAEAMLLASDPYPCAPAFSVAAYTQNSRAVTLPGAALVLDILGVAQRPKICETIVMGIAVYMVNNTNR